MAKFQHLEALDFSWPEDWQCWKRRFSRFRVAMKLATEDLAIQIATLIYSLGPSTEDVFDNELLFTNDTQSVDYDKAVRFDSYFNRAVNVIHERTLFFRPLPPASQVNHSPVSQVTFM